MRLDKLLSQLKYGSRNEIAKACKKGEVFVNGTMIKDSAFTVNPNSDSIVFKGEALVYYDNPVLMMNKQIGTVCANKDARHETVFETLPLTFARYDLKVAGRLDIDTEGLVILTNDGVLIHDIISPNKDVMKTYEVLIDRPFLRSEDLMKPMTLIDGKGRSYITKPAIVVSCEANTVVLKISEGKFHQVKLMFKAIGYEVKALKRIAIGALELDPNLQAGQVRLLTNNEIDLLFN